MTDQPILELCDDTVSSAVSLLHNGGCVLLRGMLPRKPLLAAGRAVAENAERLKEMLGHISERSPPLFCGAPMFRSRHCGIGRPRLEGVYGSADVFGHDSRLVLRRGAEFQSAGFGTMARNSPT